MSLLIRLLSVFLYAAKFGSEEGRARVREAVKLKY